MVEKRQINPAERKILTRVINRLEKNSNAKLNWKAIIILTGATILFGIHIYYYEESNWSLPSKFLVCVCPIMIWIIIENKYKGKKKENKILSALKEISEIGLITIIPVNTTRIIEFEQKEDEGTLFLVEINKNERIYLDDEQWLIPHPGKFPCDKFDIYLDKNFAYAINRKVYCNGRKIEPIKVPGNIKWKYFDGFPEDLSKEPKTFDEILSEIKTVELQSLI